MSQHPIDVDAEGRSLFLQTCPHALLRSPDVVEVYQAHAHWSKSQLALWEPNPTVQLMEAIIAFENGLNRGQIDRRKREKQEADYKRKIETLSQ